MDKKKPRYTEYEKQLLINLVQPYVSVLDSRRIDSFTLNKKREAWENITQEYNSSPNVVQPLTSKQVKKMWQNLKAKVKDAKSMENQDKKTGGGPPLPEIGAKCEEIDSDMIDQEEYESGDDDDSVWIRNKNRVTDHDSEGEFDPPKSSISSRYPPLPRTLPQPNLSSPQNKRKRYEDESIYTIKKTIYLQELEHMNKKFELERKLQLEKHNKEMEILEINKLIALKELNK